MTDKIVQTDTGFSEELPQDDSVEVGQWYWIRDEPEDDEPVLTCVTQVGSNYVEVRSPRGSSWRIHFDEFDARLTREPHPDQVINDRIVAHQAEVNRLLGRVKEETVRLGVGPRPKLEAHNETQALARLDGGMTYDGYKDALVKAKKETLPDLFKQIERENEALAEWMGAKVIPLKAQAGGLRGLVKKIDARIFNVELYAGLTEQVELIADGEPAAEDEKIRLMQRLCFMDEECLARYRTGGMEFKNIPEFDTWLTAPENRDRLLPFPRCVVSFQVRRRRKDREGTNLRDWIQIAEKEKLDEATFLYLRNGDRVYRMQTALDFGEKLFPDLDKTRLEEGRVYAKMFAGSVDRLITEHQYLGMIEDYEREVAEFEIKKRAYEAALKSPEARARAKEMGKKQPDASCVDVPWPGIGWRSNPADEYEAFTRDSVYYDDVAAHIQEQIDHHNRIGLVLQGLLDRSPVFHPHPPWEIWNADGFAAALELIYDDSRALTGGERPDFEAYRRRLNEKIGEGSVTIGQQRAWLLHEGEKEAKRLANDHRYRGDYFPTTYQPYGNPGPGDFAKVAKWAPKVRRATFAWHRERANGDGEIRTTFTCEADALLCVDAYEPGDFRQFFDDPRTRADYLEWAPLLLEAEEYHAGNRKAEEPVAPQPKGRSSWEGRRRYRRRKLREQLTGKAVRLVEEVKTKSGKKYEVGSLWRVTGGEGDRFTIAGIEEDGTRSEDHRYVVGVFVNDFEVDDSIPGEPE